MHLEEKPQNSRRHSNDRAATTKMNLAAYGSLLLASWKKEKIFLVTEKELNKQQKEYIKNSSKMTFGPILFL